MFKRVNRLDPPWRPNGPSERVLKPTMPSPTFDSEHISPKQPFSKVIISDPGKHLKFRIFLKIGISPSEKKIKFFLFIFSPDHGILSTKKVVPKKKKFPPNRNYFCTFFSVHTSELGLTWFIWSLKKNVEGKWFFFGFLGSRFGPNPGIWTPERASFDHWNPKNAEIFSPHVMRTNIKEDKSSTEQLWFSSTTKKLKLWTFVKIVIFAIFAIFGEDCENWWKLWKLVKIVRIDENCKIW